MTPTRTHVVELENLYRSLGPALLLFASAIAKDRNHAQDAVHQVFLKLLQSGDMRNVLDKKTYLFASVRNALLNDRKVRLRDVELADDSAWFEPPNRDYVAERSLRRALASLPDDQRQVIVLHIWGGLTFEQIGEVVGISANTASSRYRYAIVKLRDAMSAKENTHVNPRGQ